MDLDCRGWASGMFSYMVLWLGDMSCFLFYSVIAGQNAAYLFYSVYSHYQLGHVCLILMLIFNNIIFPIKKTKQNIFLLLQFIDPISIDDLLEKKMWMLKRNGFIIKDNKFRQEAHTTINTSLILYNIWSKYALPPLIINAIYHVKFIDEP